jgi:hypothetical protein
VIAERLCQTVIRIWKAATSTTFHGQESREDFLTVNYIERGPATSWLHMETYEEQFNTKYPDNYHLYAPDDIQIYKPDKKAVLQPSETLIISESESIQ